MFHRPSQSHGRHLHAQPPSQGQDGVYRSHSFHNPHSPQPPYTSPSPQPPYTSSSPQPPYNPRSSHRYSTHGSHPPPREPAHDSDQTLWQWFSAVDTDRSGAISVTELQAALVNGNWTKFDLDTVKMLMNIFDTDRSGTIGFNEFKGLWKYINEWQTVFRHFDKDRSGSIEGRELADALDSFGYRLSLPILSLIEQKYASGPAEEGYGPAPGITFDRFVRACVVVKTLTESFQSYDTDRDGWIQINYDQFMKMVLSAP